jgi:hypothetical protein
MQTLFQPIHLTELAAFLMASRRRFAVDGETLMQAAGGGAP